MIHSCSRVPWCVYFGHIETVSRTYPAVIVVHETMNKYVHKAMFDLSKHVLLCWIDIDLVYTTCFTTVQQQSSQYYSLSPIYDGNRKLSLDRKSVV